MMTATLLLATVAAASMLAPGVELVRGPVNGLLITRNGKTLAVYGDARPRPRLVDTLLFTHSRRDVVWAGEALARSAAGVVVPAAEAAFFSDPAATWRRQNAERHHDYACQSSRLPVRPIKVTRAVRGGEKIAWQDLSIEVLDTPGYTRGAVAYLIAVEGRRIACVGDLIYGDGRILDLYSLQDAAPELKVRGYHGWASRSAALLESLAKVAAWKPDVLVPARGPEVLQPQRAIDALTARLRRVFDNHASIDAYRWYIGDRNYGALAGRVLPAPPASWPPNAEIAGEKPPDWIRLIGNSRLIVSSQGGALLVDAGMRRIREELRRLRDSGVFRTLEGIHITHYHDDHTDLAQATAEEFDCAVFSSREMAGILEQPDRFRMPCLTPNPIRRLRVQPDGVAERWHEFRIRRWYFPGQTLYHDGLLVEKDNAESVFFTGDSFTPTGIDDYCLLNRNLLRRDLGYFRCLSLLEKLPAAVHLINQHVTPSFRFSPAQLDEMRRKIADRASLLGELLPWDGPDYGLDEQWVRLDPYAAKAEPGASTELRAVVMNHSPVNRTYRVEPIAPEGWTVAPRTVALAIAAGREAAARFRVSVPARASGLHVVTANVSAGEWDLREWTEALVEVAAK